MTRPRKTYFVQWFKRKTGPAQDLYKDTTRKRDRDKRKPMAYEEHALKTCSVKEVENCDHFAMNFQNVVNSNHLFEAII